MFASSANRKCFASAGDAISQICSKLVFLVEGKRSFGILEALRAGFGEFSNIRVCLVRAMYDREEEDGEQEEREEKRRVNGVEKEKRTKMYDVQISQEHRISQLRMAMKTVEEGDPNVKLSSPYQQRQAQPPFASSSHPPTGTFLRLGKETSET